MSVINSVVAFFSSVRLTIALCILLALVSLLGTLIPQNLDPREYTGMYGEVLGPLVSKIGVSDIYHAPGFILLLCLLAVNLTACTAKRFPSVWRSLRRDLSLPSDPTFGKWRHREAFTLELQGKSVEESIAGAVTRALGKPARQAVLDSGTRILLFEKNRLSRIGPYLAHVSILLILAGGLIGAWFGFKGAMALPEGGQEDSLWLRGGHEQIPLGFQIRCNRFLIDFYESGAPREYRSEVSILNAQGEVIRDADIRVNHPLTVNGITFYQSSYGNLSTVFLGVRDREGGEPVQVETEIRSPFPLPGETGDRAWVLDFRENMKIPAQMVKVTKFPAEDLGPAVQVGIFSKENGFGEPFWVLRDFPEMEKAREGEYLFTFEKFQSTPYTGLQVAHDPGTPLVWTGCILLIVGFFMAFMLDHEVLGVSMERQEGSRVVVCLAGRAVRHPVAYAGKFEKRKAVLRKALNKIA